MTHPETNSQIQADGAALDGPSTPSLYVSKLPIREEGYVNCPAIPFWADKDGKPDPTHVQTTLARLQKREAKAKNAYDGLDTPYTIGGQTNIAYEFLYGSQPPADRPSALTNLPLDEPHQYTLPWTNYQKVYADSQGLKGPFADTLKDKDVATRSFWPTIAYFGLPYNLLVLSKVSGVRAAELSDVFGDVWAAEDADAAVADGLVYEIDMSILTSVGSFTAPDGTTRFTPGTLTLLKQDKTNKALTPFGIQLMTSDGKIRVYKYSDKAWLYALQAVKTSITVWGIWIGHVYHWHIVTAAMQMTMYNKLPPGHKLWPLLIQQSQSLIDFDFALMTEIWDKISPPTPVNGSKALLPLVDAFAKGRTFSDDDPMNELQRRGITPEDFTVKNRWDAYPVVGDLLNIWKISQGFVQPVVDVFYTSDASVANDSGLQAWLTASRDPLDGNVALAPIETRDELTALLTSLLYRVTVHGAGSLTPTVNPALAFISNFPPCLQSTDIPDPDVKLSTKQLLERLPNTGTCGGMTTFYFTFAYTDPYVPAIPKGGVDLDPYWQPPTDPQCNAALVSYRENIRAFVNAYVKDWNKELARIGGWIPGDPPAYAEQQYEQWPRSIEI
jgi:lipoxygenase